MSLDWQDRPVFVTGAGGFIGSHLIETLAARGARVTAYIRYNSRGAIGWLRDVEPAAAERVTIVAGDLRDGDGVRRAMAGADTVFHLGALIAIPYSYLHPRDVVQTNVIGTVNALEAARELKIRRFVHTSTSEVYGTAQTERINERHPLQGQSPYSASKIAADAVVDSYTRSFHVPAITVRPFNTYGPRQSARAVIPTIATQLLAGATLKLGNLEALRDFTYVSDTVAGFMAAAEKTDGIGMTVNLGADEEISVREIAVRLGRIIGVEPDFVIDAQRLRPEKSEVQRLRSDNRLAGVELGWRPTVSLDQGLSRTVEWLRRNLAVYRTGHYEV